ncbi:MAG: hypothetical protein ABIH20_06610 [Candidatus Diapherotrites archaeon]
MVSRTNQVMHYPTLKTVLMIEGILKKAREPLSRYEIIKRSDNKIMRPTLNIIIEYMGQRGMVLDSKKGIIWTYTPPQKMRKLLEESVEA